MMTSTYETIPVIEMTTEELRAEYAMLRRNAGAVATKEEFLDACKLGLREVEIAPRDATPGDWVKAARSATFECDRCHGSGEYLWGACVNGRMTNRGVCFRCEGKGVQNQDDFRRNYGSDMNMFRKAIA
jgi:DnaJ-class molecular chaperone